MKLRVLLIAALAALINLAHDGYTDLAWPLFGARALLDGQNPYAAPMPLGLPLFYPLPALMFLAPVAGLPIAVASLLFSVLSAALLAYAVLRYRPRGWPLFLSAPFFVACGWSQWSMLVTAAALIPALVPIGLCKPSLGLPLLLLRRPMRSSVLIACGVLAGSLLLLPSWPLDWFHSIASHDSAIPLLTIPGAIVIVALIRWRDQRARLLVGMAAMPQRFYDPLILWLIPSSARGGLWLSLLSWLAVLPWLLRLRGVPLAQPPLILALAPLYLAALALVLLPAQQRDIRGVGRVAAIPKPKHFVRRDEVGAAD